MKSRNISKYLRTSDSPHRALSGQMKKKINSLSISKISHAHTKPLNKYSFSRFLNPNASIIAILRYTKHTLASPRFATLKHPSPQPAEFTLSFHSDVYSYVPLSERLSLKILCTIVFSVILTPHKELYFFHSFYHYLIYTFTC